MTFVAFELMNPNCNRLDRCTGKDRAMGEYRQYYYKVLTYTSTPETTRRNRAGRVGKWVFKAGTLGP